jgi:two-component system nitrogen regulation response regulator NtrX
MAHEILIVDDEDDIRSIIADTLADEGYETRGAADADSALAAIRMRRPALVLLDVWLEGSRIDGIGVLEAVRAEHPNLPIVMISGHGTVELAVDAIRKGAYDFIEKPFKTDRLLLVLDRAIENARLKRENEELRFRAGADLSLIGTSSAITQVTQMIERVAPSNSRVLISGAPGTGKEVVARLIHARSARAAGPFVVLNCATMHPDRMEIELFGSDGPGPRKVGTLEQAHGGTLLLDEVADMPLETQAKILRVLQDQLVQRVGGTSSFRVDVRVVASTAKDLHALIENGRFREDLFYRLRVVPVEVPPLRNRREDIPALARHLIAAAAQRAGQPARAFSAEALAAMQAYSWPGNVRQLCNVVDWLLIMTPPDVSAISVRHLPPEITGSDVGLPRVDRSAELMTLGLREARESFERDYLLAQLARFDGNISRTASYIGMERSALHRKLKLLGVADADRAEVRARSYDA